jgi:hypothetical protein
MLVSKIILLLINLLGGIAVIGSYVFGLKNSGTTSLWGGVPESIRPVYFISMILAALGYFAFINFILFKNNFSPTVYNFLYLIFLGILVPSALWMWVGVQIVLIIVGISSCVLVWFLFNLKDSGIAYWLAVLGSIYFAFHTAVLDMILWPILFRR